VEHVTTYRTASVIIRTKNEAKWLGATIDGVRAQSIAAAEIIVIDSGSTDGTLAIAQRKGVRLLTISPEEWGYSRAINRAAEVASGEILVILSAHCPPVGSRWLEHLLAPFEDPTVAGVWGPNHRPGRPVPPPGPAERQEAGTYGAHNRTWGLSNANSAVRRDLWKEFPFDESLPAAEDKAWGMEAMARGYALVHEPAAGVWHPAHRPTASFRRNRAVEQGFAMLFPDTPNSVTPSPVRIAVNAVARSLRFHREHRDLKAFLHDVGRTPSTISALVGSAWARRRLR
jgi:rhamnosyltransferase